ncbi:MAG: 23S rRNA (pseudouridine(1915)-N(3))-methyltransferase RlmH [Lachnospiraceae bacterium]|nr:23S rRNA (pseudouridine(1915)-N(3))-methyltransferase RlmH [Lachnospiraceae bacterium]
MKITILAVGKMKEKFFADAVTEYRKRLSRYCKLEMIEVADERTPEHASGHEEDLIRAREGERLRKYIKEGAYVISLAIQGRQASSEEFSEKIESLGVQGESHIIFIIGGSIGIDRGILQESRELLSFSKMTFPHQLMRVVLLEQIYRGFRIMKGEPYHK